MSFNDNTFKKLGFRPKRGEKGVITASAEVALNNYITVDLQKINEEFVIVGIEVDGKKADELRREYFLNYSIEEVIDFYTKY